MEPRADEARQETAGESRRKVDMATATRKKGLNWFGSLTMANAEEIGQLIQELLGGKRFTIVTYSPDRPHSRPMVLTSERLQDPVKVSTEFEGKPWGHVTLHTTYGVFGFCSYEPEDEHAYCHREDRDTPYLVFDWTQLMVEHKAPCGDALRWIFKVEESD